MATGLGTRSLKLEIDSIDYTNSVSTVKITSGDSDSDFLSFADAAAGGSRAYKLEMTLTQSLASASLWRLMYDQAGTEVDVVIRFNGGTTATATQPHVTFSAVVSEPDGDFLGGDADASTSARFTTDASFEIIDKPVIVSA